MMCGGGYMKEWAIELETHFAGRKKKKKEGYMWRIWICGFSTTENAYEQKKTIDFFCEMILSAEGEGWRPRKTEKERDREKARERVEESEEELKGERDWSRTKKSERERKRVKKR